MLAKDTADGDYVGREKGEEGKGEDNVEGKRGTEVDETEDTGCDGRQVHCIIGDVTFVIHLRVVRNLILIEVKNEAYP